MRKRAMRPTSSPAPRLHHRMAWLVPKSAPPRPIHWQTSKGESQCHVPWLAHDRSRHEYGPWRAKCSNDPLACCCPLHVAKRHKTAAPTHHKSPRKPRKPREPREHESTSSRFELPTTACAVVREATRPIHMGQSTTVSIPNIAPGTQRQQSRSFVGHGPFRFVWKLD